jgi:cobalt-zinc-cadmium efflux system outer membrane protein
MSTLRVRLSENRMESFFGWPVATPPPAAMRRPIPALAADAGPAPAARRRARWPARAADAPRRRPGRIAAGRLIAAVLLAAAGCGLRAQALASDDAARSGMRQALEAAWALDARARSLPDRREALDARARAAGALFAGPAAVGLFQRNDRLQRHTGLLEAEAEIAAPLWNPGTRRAAKRQVAADREALDRSLPEARLLLAGELRERAAQAMLARIARDAALRRRESAAVLAEDVARRVRAGESARLEALQAEALRGQAAADLADAERALAQAEAQWTALTGRAVVASLEDEADAAAPPPASASASASASSSASADPSSGGGHPLLVAAEARAAVARAQLDGVLADRRDPVEVGVGVSRDQSAHGERSDRLLRLSIRIPLSSEHRNAPRQAAARAEVSAAEADAEAVARQIDAAARAARASLDAARRADAAAAERARLSAEAQELVARAYRLGEISLPDRLRAENERYEAERSRALARTEVQRARSQLFQALGQLP